MLKYFVNSFIFFALWEFLQSPFYQETEVPLSTIIYNRIHCTIGDILILTSVILIWSALKRKIIWLKKPKFIDYTMITILGISYTTFSEYHNTVILKSWTYSSLMPIIPFFNVGLIPIIQWIILPNLILYFSSKD